LIQYLKNKNCQAIELITDFFILQAVIIHTKISCHRNINTTEVMRTITYYIIIYIINYVLFAVCIYFSYSIEMFNTASKITCFVIQLSAKLVIIIFLFIVLLFPKTRTIPNLGIRIEYREGMEVCGICLVNFIQSDVILIYPCAHIYHSHCMDQWLQIKTTCPTCRTELYNIDNNQLV